jgi:hypothetical protein
MPWKFCSPASALAILVTPCFNTSHSSYQARESESLALTAWPLLDSLHSCMLASQVARDLFGWRSFGKLLYHRTRKKFWKNHCFRATKFVVFKHVVAFENLNALSMLRACLVQGVKFRSIIWGVRILIKKQITESGSKPWDEFIKLN